MSEFPFKPYLLRAFHEWTTNRGHVPHIVVDCSVAGVQVPVAWIKDNKVVLNISYLAADRLQMTDAEIKFNAALGSNRYSIIVPINAVRIIYNRDTGDNFAFDEASEPQQDTALVQPQRVQKNSGLKQEMKPQTVTKPQRDRSHLRVVK